MPPAFLRLAPALVMTLFFVGLQGCVAPMSQRPRLLRPGSHYTVRSGDTLYGISRRTGVGVQQLQRHNRLANPRALAVGQTLQIPHGPKARRSLRREQALPPRGPSAAGSALARSASPPVPLRWPTQGVITSRFGQRSGRNHDGIDIGAPRGSMVLAAAAGEVMYSKRHGGYGNLVIVRHSPDLVTVYAHHEVNLVRAGERVRKGQRIARVGSSGRASGPHLHFEVRRRTRPQNPLQFLPPQGQT